MSNYIAYVINSPISLQKPASLEQTRSALLSLSRLDPLELPLTCELKHPTKKVVVVSHPGWSRRWLDPDSGTSLQQFSAYRALSLGLHKGGRSIKVYRDFILPKLWYASRGCYASLLLECMAEEAIISARKLGQTVVITVPAIVQMQSDNTPRLVPYELEGQHFTTHLKTLVGGRRGIYVLPTMAARGELIGAFERRGSYGENFATINSALGKRFLQPLVHPKIETLLFCGGFFDACMQGTLSHFALVSAQSHLAPHRVRALRTSPLFLEVADSLSLSQNRSIGESINAEPAKITLDSATRDTLKKLLEHSLRAPTTYPECRTGIIKLFRTTRASVNNWESMWQLERTALESALRGSSACFNLIHPSAIDAYALEGEYKELSLPSITDLLKLV